MTNREFIDTQYGVSDGKEKRHGNLIKDEQGNIFSYGSHYPLKFTVGVLTFVNNMGYSNTTSKHIGLANELGTHKVKLTGRWFDIKTVTSDLKKEKKELRDIMDTKKRFNTQVYRDLSSRVIEIEEALYDLKV